MSAEYKVAAPGHVGQVVGGQGGGSSQGCFGICTVYDSEVLEVELVGPASVTQSGKIREVSTMCPEVPMKEVSLRV